MRTARLPVLLLLSISRTALASDHLWEIQEIYTNADGSVQFVEFFTTAGGEFFVGSARLQLEIGGVAVKTFDFPTNLAGSTTANRTFLVATANFATLFGVTPDYVIPSNFLSAGLSGTLNFGPNFDRVSLSGLPTNGIASLNGLVFNSSPSAFSVNAQATPRNFAGQQITVPEPSAALLVFTGTLGGLLGRRRTRNCQD
jgi:hypothetical protein